MEKFEDLIMKRRRKQYCDAHITGELPVAIREKGKLRFDYAVVVIAILTGITACTLLEASRNPGVQSIDNKRAYREIIAANQYGHEYSGMATETGKGQMYIMEQNSKKAMPLLPPPAKRLTEDLVVRVSVPERTVSKEIVPLNQKADVLIEGTAQSPVKIRAVQNIMSATYGKAVIYFPLGKHRLSEREKDQINLFLSSMKMSAKEDYAATVEGFTCDIGSKARNDFLAKERAKSVAEYLEQNGVKVGKIEGKGKHNYISKNRELNRRVEVESKENITAREQS
jgi:outer membrane protein OmpA-like peptidoglycan-associated protein